MTRDECHWNKKYDCCRKLLTDHSPLSVNVDVRELGKSVDDLFFQMEGDTHWEACVTEGAHCGSTGYGHANHWLFICRACAVKNGLIW